MITNAVRKLKVWWERQRCRKCGAIGHDPEMGCSSVNDLDQKGNVS